MDVWGIGSEKTQPDQRAPLGQVLVKEAWEPVKAKSGDRRSGRLASQARDKRPYATIGQDTYHAGNARGLFIMFKTHEETPGTDDGWVYGTVAADLKTVTAVGRLKNCMQCHQQAEFDRQIGLARQK